jgi:hypothetical protein
MRDFISGFLCKRPSVTESKLKRGWVGDENAEILSVFIFCKSELKIGRNAD